MTAFRAFQIHLFSYFLCTNMKEPVLDVYLNNLVSSRYTIEVKRIVYNYVVYFFLMICVMTYLQSNNSIAN